MHKNIIKQILYYLEFLIVYFQRSVLEYSKYVFTRNEITLSSLIIRRILVHIDGLCVMWKWFFFIYFNRNWILSTDKRHIWRTCIEFFWSCDYVSGNARNCSCHHLYCNRCYYYKRIILIRKIAYHKSRVIISIKYLYFIHVHCSDDFQKVGLKDRFSI